MGISRQAHYQAQQRMVQRCQRAETVIELVKDTRMRQPRLGTRKLLPSLTPTSWFEVLDD